MDASSNWGEEFVVGSGEGSQTWVNVLANPHYLLRLSGQGRGDSFLLANGQSWPLTKTIEDLDQPDLWPGRQIFVHDYDSHEFWPLLIDNQRSESNFQVRHGAGRSIFSKTEHNIASRVTFLLDLNKALEFWQVTIKNNDKGKRRLGLFFTVEWALPASERPRTCWEDNILFVHPRSLRSYPVLGFITLNRQVDSYDGARTDFIGPLGDRMHPMAVVDGKCSRSTANVSAPVGVLQKNIAFGPLGEASLTLMMGGEVITDPSSKNRLTQSKQTIKRTVREYCQDKYLESVASRAQTSWQSIREKTLINTPDHLFNHSFNQWLKLQSHLMLHLPEQHTNSNLPEGPIPVLQGVANSLPNDPATALSRLTAIATRQKREGGLINSGDDLSADYYFASAIIRALEETGDQKLAEKEIPYGDFGSGSLLEHLSRSLRYRLKLQEENGLVIRSDNNIYLTDNAQLAINLQQAVPIFTRFNENSASHYFHERYHQLVEASQRYFWQGHWFSFARYDGRKIGTPKNNEQKIFLEAQSWAVLAGFGQQAMQERALRSALKRLGTQYGPASCLPAGTNQAISNEEEGEGANGGILTTTLAPFISALAKLGWGDEIEKIWRQTNGLHRYLTSPRLVNEPYGYPKYIFGPDSLRFGQQLGFANLSQNPGSLWHALLESVLGIRATIGGLKVSPCLPRDWRQVEITRQFRGAQYHFRIINNFRQCRGIDRIIVDGLRLTGDVIKPYNTGNHYIEVYLG